MRHSTFMAFGTFLILVVDGATLAVATPNQSLQRTRPAAVACGIIEAVLGGPGR